MLPNSQVRALEALARSLLPGDSALVERLRHATSDPVGYVERHAAELRLRGITEPSPDLLVVAFLDHLKAMRAGEEIDWREEPGVALSYILELRRCPSGDVLAVDREVFDDLEDDDSLTVTALLPELAARLSRIVALRLFDLENDAFFVVLVDAEHLPEVEELSRAAGLPMIEPSGG